MDNFNFIVRADVLQQLVVHNVEMTKCQKLFANSESPIYRKLQLCAGGVKGEDSCAGDSGSGMIDVVTNQSTKMIKYNLVGIVSWGTSKCGTGKPGVYVKVAAYLDWIMSSLCKYVST